MKPINNLYLLSIPTGRIFLFLEIIQNNLYFLLYRFEQKYDEILFFYNFKYF